MEKKLHIIALNIPYPPDYGGVIDIYYKIRALHDSGIKVFLHTFQYDRKPSKELELVCEKVYYYPRKTGFFQNLHFLPYIVFSRRSPELLQNLKKDSWPILFEGIHSCFHLGNRVLKERLKIVRMHNIEHHYYTELAGAEKGLFRKLYFLLEGFKLKLFERKMKAANYIAAISHDDLNYFSKKFRNVFLLNPFHSNTGISSKEGKGDYILYHGNLSVPENYKAVIFLINEVFKDLDIPVVIAGKNPDIKLYQAVKNTHNIKIVKNPGKEEMDSYVQNAMCIVLFTFQTTGIKLKLVDSLFQGRFIIANTAMVKNTGLENTCIIADEPKDIIIGLKKTFQSNFTSKDIADRELNLKSFESSQSIKSLLNILKG